MTTFSSKTVHELYSLSYGILQIPFEGIETEAPILSFCTETFVLTAQYKALIEGELAHIKAIYTCPVVEFLKEIGVFDSEEAKADNALWLLVDHEVLQSVNSLGQPLESEAVFTYIEDCMPTCPYCGERVETPWEDEDKPWRGVCKNGHDLLYQFDDEQDDKEAFLVNVDIYDENDCHEHTRLVLVESDSFDSAQEDAVNELTDEATLVEGCDKSFTDKKGLTYWVGTPKEVLAQDIEALKRYL